MRSELTTLREVTIGLVFILAPLLAGWAALLVTRLFGYRSYEVNMLIEFKIKPYMDTV